MDYFSNRDRDVFLINLPKMIDRGALMSRYSRAKETDIRRLWEKEFSSDEQKGERFYDLIFLEYGDESISELVTAQVGIQNITNILSKIIEEGRIGLSYLEKSSRYVSYGDKINGRYLYADPNKIGIPEKFRVKYDEFCNETFDEYVFIKEDLISNLKETYPIDKADFRTPDGKRISLGESDETDRLLTKSYENSVRSRALDEARFILPSSTLTNIGISGNARAFSHLLERLKSIDSQETLWLYRELFSELKQIFPRLIDSVESIHGKENIEYLRKLKNFKPVEIEFSRGRNGDVNLLKYESDDEVSSTILASYYFERSEGTFDSIKELIGQISIESRRKMINEISDLRNNRRQKPDRSLEHVNYTFETIINYGAFRELQRHRLLSIQRKLLSTSYGYDIPPNIRRNESLLRKFESRMKKSIDLFKEISEIDPFSAQYVVPFAFRYPVLFSANLREIVYFTELRSTPQAHFDLRNISWQIVDRIVEVNPSVQPFFRFVNREKEELGRLSAEVRKEAKRNALMDKNK